jgi:hypothetical protein
MLLLAIPALVATHFGFAGTLGELIYRARAYPEKVYLVAALSFGGLVFLPASFALPLPGWLRYLTWCGALGLTLAFSFRPSRLPGWLWTPHFVYRYLGVLMALILLWSLGGELSPPMVLMSGSAALAGGLALQRSFRWRWS